MDETSMMYLPDLLPGRICTATPAPSRHSTRAQARARFTWIAFCTDNTAVQRILPQILLINRRH
eukprot:6327630-Prorocentrum_lima.AAC.1